MAESSKFKEQKIDTRASISRLPNELLLKILSHLPLKQALATSILSNTWKALCSQFLQDNHYRFAYFDDFVLISQRHQKCIHCLKRSHTSSSNRGSQCIPLLAGGTTTREAETSTRESLISSVLSKEHIVNTVEDIMEAEIHVIDVPALSDQKEEDEKLLLL
ncbi:FBD-associated F-box protein [Senna tora]|uniref:FBD-associated F-box protein n=1 Tax=Senna tora TaxID=362788 RepID=A0A834TP76_9FABA|nr:FBD-associated F-box protein [Senna tora]